MRNIRLKNILIVLGALVVASGVVFAAFLLSSSGEQADQPVAPAPSGNSVNVAVADGGGAVGYQNSDFSIGLPEAWDHIHVEKVENVAAVDHWEPAVEDKKFTGGLFQQEGYSSYRVFYDQDSLMFDFGDTKDMYVNGTPYLQTPQQRDQALADALVKTVDGGPEAHGTIESPGLGGAYVITDMGDAGPALDAYIVNNETTVHVTGALLSSGPQFPAWLSTIRINLP